MTKRIEIEQKFFCKDTKKLEQFILVQNFDLKNCQVEQDEYFTDMDCKFVKNRTCLRLRKTDNQTLELTFKGKSFNYKSFYAKRESNIALNLDEYDDLLMMLFSLGYYSYSVVNKKRKTYSKIVDNLTYNIMMDEIEGIGSFVEFELLTNTECEKDNLLKKLDSFVTIFKKLNLEEADLPYRDFVAEKLYYSILPKENLKAVFLDLDGTLINSEQLFFKSFQKVLKKLL